MNFRLAGHSPPTERADAWVFLAAGPEDLPPPTTPALRRVRAMCSSWTRTQRFDGKPGDLVILPSWESLPADHVVLVGIGAASPPTPADLRRAMATLARRLRVAPWQRLRIGGQFALDATLARALALGWMEGGYEFERYRARRPDDRPARLGLLSFPAAAAPRAITKALDEGRILGEILREVRDIANLPGNDLPPAAVARHARSLARRHGLRCRVLGRVELARAGCGALLAVAQGSRQPPCVIVLEHRGRGRGAPVALVGKTITFDSGGLSLKTSKGMEWMKYDKSGGMAVLATLVAAARLKLPTPVTGLLAVAENMPGGGATRPGDIVRTRSGRTVEILNTDAEGRLVLADALTLAGDRKPRAVVDLATLTGAAVTALGATVSAVMGNDDPLRAALFAAGERTGDRLWPLPLYPEYLELIRSPFADLRNIGDGTAGAIVGGTFLREFAPAGIPWAHIDLTHAWEERHQPHAAAGANLFGTALLVDWIRSLSP